ncbi:MAG: undecaprenyl/decaprenyl-phosphate alpha-N-acetylglucosaminyl 1-phosphate transferase [Candidatus Zixiibacteriota bacterium]|nr:MAG: undecaprenyl/decaprenyl-phosphate alpha-N-acetylglucosaminyl 1-phosphate transferase [candidate division Zixibacteria bacterium]
MNRQIPAYFIVIIISGYLTYLFVPLVKSYCVKKGLLDKPGPRKIHPIAVPRLGGVTFIVAFTVALALGFIAAPDLWLENWKSVLGLLLGGIVIFSLGITDDIKSISPLPKFLWQIAAALIPVLAGIRPDVINIPYYKVVSLELWSIPLSVFWVVIITNTFNLLDGLDGLAAGVGAIASITFVILSIVLDIPLASLLAAGVFGICIGFLKYNYHPAQIFMGDTGSLFIGYVLGVLSLYWPKSYASIVMFVPLLALGLPVLEIVSTTIRRLMTGRRIYVADKRHLFHFLLDQGFGHKWVVLFFYFVSIQFSVMAVGFVVGRVNIILVLETVFIIFIAIFLSRKIKSGGRNG